jgi:hypothetical protein
MLKARPKPAQPLTAVVKPTDLAPKRVRAWRKAAGAAAVKGSPEWPLIGRIGSLAVNLYSTRTAWRRRRTNGSAPRAAMSG